MILRRLFLFAVGMLFTMPTFSQTDTRDVWVDEAYRMAYPVLFHLSEGTLLETMPIQQVGGYNSETVTHLEAVGRLLCGIAPWLELPDDGSQEAVKRAEILALAHKGLANAVDPESPDYLNFRSLGQPLVDAAFLAQAFLRSPKKLWAGLDAVTRERLITEIDHTRQMKPWFNNWLLFSGTVEAFFYKFVGMESYDFMRLDYALRQHEAWYLGDGLYSDGPVFHNDYYNSFVIHPMLVDIIEAVYEGWDAFPDDPIFSPWHREKLRQRMTRYAAILERSISPEGTFPVVGRSILYRTGCMHALAHAALLHILPGEVEPAQVREALTLVIRNLLQFPGTYDDQGWLNMGFAGNYKEAGEYYLSTGSMYLASTVFLPLGLPSDDPFWADPPAPWTSRKAWSGKAFPRDEAVKY